MTSGVPVSDADRHAILKLFATGNWRKAAIGKRLGVDRKIVQRVIDDAARVYWNQQASAAAMSDLCDPH